MKGGGGRCREGKEEEDTSFLDKRGNCSPWCWEPGPRSQKMTEKRLGLQSEIFNTYVFMILPRLTRVNISGQCTRWNECSPLTFARTLRRAVLALSRLSPPSL